MSEKGITGILEFVRGFVGRHRPPKFDSTIRGIPRIQFDLVIGQLDEAAGKYPTIRHCVGYRQIAENLKNLKVNDYVYAEGWVDTEAIRDEYYKPVIVDNQVLKIEKLLLKKAEIREYIRKPEIQPLLIATAG